MGASLSGPAGALLCGAARHACWVGTTGGFLRTLPKHQRHPIPICREEQLYNCGMDYESLSNAAPSSYGSLLLPLVVTEAVCVALALLQP